MDWEVELIPDSDKLFMRAHKDHIQDGELQPGVFRDQGGDGAMSTHWSKYLSAQGARRRARVQSANAVISLGVGPTRAVPVEVFHSPVADDQSHSSVRGKKDAKTRTKLVQLAVWEVRLEDPVDV